MITNGNLKSMRPKTRIIIFNSNGDEYKKISTNGNHELENVKEYIYLGLIFYKWNKFNTTKKTLN